MQNPAKTFSCLILLCFEVLVNCFFFQWFQYEACSHLGTRSEERNMALQPNSSRPSTEVAEHGTAQVTQKARVDTTRPWPLTSHIMTFKLRTWLEWVDNDGVISNLLMVLRPSQQRIQWKDSSASWYSNARCNLQAEAVVSPALDDLKQEVGVTFSAGCQQKPTKGTFVAA